MFAAQLFAGLPQPLLQLAQAHLEAEAMTTRPDGFFYYLIAGGLLIVAGVVLALTFAEDVRFWFRTGWALVWVGVLVGVLSLAIRVPLHYINRSAATTYHVSNMQILVNNLLIKGETIPSDISALPTDSAHFDSKQLYDAWHHKLKIGSVKVDGVDCAVVISAGADGRFGTRDDIIGMPFGIAELSHKRVIALRDIIHARLDKRQPVPLELKALANMAGLKPGQLLDGWGRPLRLTLKTIKGGQPIFTVTSAGKDGIFDTADDIREITTYTVFPIAS